MSALPDPVAADAALHRIADDLFELLVCDHLEPSVIALSPAGPDLDIAFLPLDGVHPEVVLRGFRAPDDTWALGTAAHGWATDVTRPRQPRVRASVLAAVSRSGEVATRVEVAGRGALTDPGPGDGIQFDLLRRGLGLETPPPPAGTNVLFAHYWLAEILAAPAATVDSFDAAARCTPMYRRLHGTDPEIDAYLDEACRRPVADPGTPSIARVFALHESANPWSAIRAEVATGVAAFADCDPTDADWFDDGSFARHVLTGLPPIEFLEDALDAALAPSVVDGIRTVLRAIDVGPADWPHDLAGDALPSAGRDC